MLILYDFSGGLTTKRMLRNSFCGVRVYKAKDQHKQQRHREENPDRSLPVINMHKGPQQTLVSPI